MKARSRRGCLDRRILSNEAIEKFAEETYWDIVVPLFPDIEDREKFVMDFAAGMEASFLKARLKRRQDRKRKVHRRQVH